MEKINPEISVFTAFPNNGYLALVFQDNGVAFTANCKKKDAYEGLLEVCAHFLLDAIDDVRPNIQELKQNPEMTEEDMEKIDRYATAVAAAHAAFCQALESRLSIGSVAKQLEANGLPSIFAKMLATGMEMFPGKFERADTDDDCDEEDSDDSDDEYNLD